MTSIHQYIDFFKHHTASGYRYVNPNIIMGLFAIVKNRAIMNFENLVLYICYFVKIICTHTVEHGQV